MSRRSRWGVDHVLASRRRTLFVVALVGGLALLPFTTTPAVTRTVLLGLLFVILGVSWNLLAGYAGQISLGHAAFFGTGAFVTAWLTHPARAGLPEWIGVPVIPSLGVAVVAAALLGLVTGPIVFRLTGHYFAIGTLAVAVLLQLLLEDQVQLSGGAGAGFNVNSPLSQDAMYLIALLMAVASVAVAYRLVRSRVGLGMRAVHGDETAASSLGVDPLRYKLAAYTITGGMAGAAGAIWAHVAFTISAQSTLGIEWMIEILAVVILGGMGTMLGPVLGAGLFLAIDQGLGQVVGLLAMSFQGAAVVGPAFGVLNDLIGELSTTIEGLLIIGFVLYAPRGLYGLLEDRLEPTESGRHE